MQGGSSFMMEQKAEGNL
jgi:hypothetical protein